MARSQDPLTMDFILLGIIGMNPIHPYELHKQLSGSEELKTLWTFNQSRLYAVLEKIEKNGLIVTSVVPGDSLPARKVCTITDQGRETFEKWLHSPVEHMNEIRSDFLARLYFLKNRPAAERLQVVQMQKLSCEGWLCHFEEKLSEHPSAEDYLHMVYSFRAAFIRTTLQWLDTIC